MARFQYDPDELAKLIVNTSADSSEPSSERASAYTPLSPCPASYDASIHVLQWTEAWEADQARAEAALRRLISRLGDLAAACFARQITGLALARRQLVSGGPAADPSAVPDTERVPAADASPSPSGSGRGLLGEMLSHVMSQGAMPTFSELLDGFGLLPVTRAGLALFYGTLQQAGESRESVVERAWCTPRRGRSRRSSAGWPGCQGVGSMKPRSRYPPAQVQHGSNSSAGAQMSVYEPPPPSETMPLIIGPPSPPPHLGQAVIQAPGPESSEEPEPYSFDWWCKEVGNASFSEGVGGSLKSSHTWRG